MQALLLEIMWGFRQKDRKEHRDKDLAAMARGGFEYQLVKKVIDARDADALDDAR